MQHDKQAMTSERSEAIIKKLKQYYGNIESGLSFSGIYELAISVALSAQTTDRQVNTVTPALFRKYPDFESLSAASVNDVESMIKSVGLYKTKARNIINLSKEVVNRYNNLLPGKFEELIKLPGIGRKSANVILSMGYKKPAFAVDTHILRVANRLGYVDTRDPYKAEKALMHYIKKRDWIRAHLLIIRHGRNLCRARNPLCPDCPVSELCGFVNIPKRP